MRRLLLSLALSAVACTASNDKTGGNQDPIIPGEPDAATTEGPPDAPERPPYNGLDAGPTPPPTGSNLPAGAACATGDQCAGGTCLGAPGQLDEDNPRFYGGYCTAIGCTPGTQEGCGADEICVEASDAYQGGYCVELCSKADGLVCDRPDHVCLGLGSYGGCYSSKAVECNVQQKTGCGPEDICVRIGYEDRSLGRCETRCDPLHDTTCRSDQSCYYIKTYNAAFCGLTGTIIPEQACSCDKCCVKDYACTPDLDGAGRHCKKYCSVDNPSQCAQGQQCVPLEMGSPFGGCVAPGSAGT